jgi:hypothetical protein
MESRYVLPIAFLLAAGLAGCVSYGGAGLRPGTSSEAEVRASMGPPAFEATLPDGTHRLAYPRGPLGTQTFMVDVGADGRLASIRSVLNDDTFYRIQPGMTRDDILRLIGPPGDTMAFSRTATDAWMYRYVDTWGYIAIFSVTFDRNGIVVSKFSERIDRDKSH